MRERGWYLGFVMYVYDVMRVLMFSSRASSDIKKNEECEWEYARKWKRKGRRME